MIFSENPEPTLKEFSALMKKTDRFLNEDAKKHENYYSSRNNQKLEEDVRDALTESWNEKIEEDRLSQWIKLCSESYAGNDKEKYRIARSVLKKIFSMYSIYNINEKIYLAASPDV